MESGENEELRERRERRGSFDATRRRDLRWSLREGGGKLEAERGRGVEGGARTGESSVEVEACCNEYL